jgi:hypothetical protein
MGRKRETEKQRQVYREEVRNRQSLQVRKVGAHREEVVDCHRRVNVASLGCV